MNYKAIIGLETHIELSTEQKMFCSCGANYFGQAPNTLTCPVCLGLPGALPVPNEQAIKWTIMIGLALNCKINTRSFFERKHYFYPDLAKGYQISQYLKPFCYDGFLMVDKKKIRINRVHLEEDTGKLLHGEQFKDPGSSYVDFNRSGVPLVEIVTEPDIETAEKASAYLKKLQLIIRYLGVSDCDMEKGSMRCEPNISLVKRETWNVEHKLPKYKVEVKNINSFKFVAKAITYEIERQTMLLESGKTPTQETRRYLESSGKTQGMRSKEFAHDYRYFPEPDIPPFEFSESYLDEIKKQLASSELPENRFHRLTKELNIREDIAQILTEDKSLGNLTVEVIAISKNKAQFSNLATYIVNNKQKVKKMTAKSVIELFEQATTKKTPNPKLIQEAISQILKTNPQAVLDFKAGKQNAMQFLLGQIIKQLGKQIAVQEVIVALRKELISSQ